MRHWDAATEEVDEKSVQFPLGSNNRHSVMGPVKHLRKIRFHAKDAKWLKEFYGTKEGDFIVDYEIRDVMLDPKQWDSIDGYETCDAKEEVVRRSQCWYWRKLASCFTAFQRAKKGKGYEKVQV